MLYIREETGKVSTGCARQGRLQGRAEPGTGSRKTGRIRQGRGEKEFQSLVGSSFEREQGGQTSHFYVFLFLHRAGGRADNE